MKEKCNCDLRLCKYYRGIRIKTGRRRKAGLPYCKAFPYGIPEEITCGDNDHSKPLEGQENNIVYEKGIGKDKIKPYLARHMEQRNLHGQDNLCCTIHDIYMKSSDEEVRLWCRYAMRMSKNMMDALEEYKLMLVELGVDVGHDAREDWQFHKKSLYRSLTNA